MIRYPLPDALSLDTIERLELLQEKLRIKERIFKPRLSKRRYSPWTPVRKVDTHDYDER